MQYEVKLLDKAMVSADILVFKCQKPDGFRFRAGQFCFLNLPDIGFGDERGLRRHLTIASSPLEEDLMFATKISESAFKRTLKEMPVHKTIVIEDPLGLFGLPEDRTDPLVFLAGGIGITPFRSMIRYATGVRSDNVITLFYSNRVPEEAVFLPELEEISAGHVNIRVVPTMTRVESTSAGWGGLRGRITPAMIREHHGEWQHSRYYIAGPPKMTDSMREILTEMYIPSERIRIERFTGYK